MDRKSKVFTVFSFTTISIILIIILMALFGIPFGKFISKKSIENYLGERYPDRQLVISNITYNIEDGDYNAEIFDKNKSLITTMRYHWENNSLIDQESLGGSNNFFNNEMQVIIRKLNPSISYVGGNISAIIKANILADNSIKTNYLIEIALTSKEKNFNITKYNYINLVNSIIDRTQFTYPISKIQIAYTDKKYVKTKSYIIILTEKQMSLSPKEKVKLIKIPDGAMFK